MASEAAASTERWHVYLVRTARCHLYTGIAKDVERRLAEHEGEGARGAKALRGRGPLELAYRCEVGTLGMALRVEHALKRLPKFRKEDLVSRAPEAAELLAWLGVEPLEDRAE